MKKGTKKRKVVKIKKKKKKFEEGNFLITEIARVSNRTKRRISVLYLSSYNDLRSRQIFEHILQQPIMHSMFLGRCVSVPLDCRQTDLGN